MSTLVSSRLSSAQATYPLLFDSFVLTSIRAILFFACRRFLKLTLSPALRRVSKEDLAGQTVTSDGKEEDEDGDSTTPLPSPLPSPSPGGLPFSSRDVYTRQGSDVNLPLQPLSQPFLDKPTPSPSSLSARRGKSLSLENGGGRGGQKVKDAKGGGRWYGRAARFLLINVFSLCFSESCMLFCLVMLESIDLLHASALKSHFTFSLDLLLVLLLVVTPLLQSLLITRYRSSSSTSPRSPTKGSLLRRTGFALIPFGLSSLAFRSIPVPAAMLTDGSIVTSSLARLSVLGVIILGLLSGFGSITTALSFFHLMSRSHWSPITPSDLLSAERSLHQTRHDLAHKREELRRKREAGIEGGGGGGWGMKGLLRNPFGERVDGSEGALEMEVKGLEMMELQVGRSLEGMKQRKKRMEFSSTLRGRLWNFIGYLFAAYCVSRLLVSAFNLFIFPRFISSPSLNPTSSLASSFASSVTTSTHLPSTSSMTTNPPTSSSSTAATAVSHDWLSYLLALGLSHLPFPVDVPLWSRQISLGMVGVIIGSSVQYVMRAVAKLLRLGKASVGGVVLLLGLGQLMALYLLSLLIQLRTSLPPPSSSFPQSSSSTTLLSSLPPFEMFNSLFDMSYLFAALVTIAASWLDSKANGGAGDPGVELWRDGGV